MRHEIEASKAEPTADLGDGSEARSRRGRELSDAELAYVAGGVQKVREAASPCQVAGMRLPEG
jgi:hypothetical protein